MPFGETQREKKINKRRAVSGVPSPERKKPSHPVKQKQETRPCLVQRYAKHHIGKIVVVTTLWWGSDKKLCQEYYSEEGSKKKCRGPRSR